jgi:hypothetical protein
MSFRQKRAPTGALISSPFFNHFTLKNIQLLKFSFFLYLSELVLKLQHGRDVHHLQEYPQEANLGQF